jgi:hypothetical protein
MICFSSTWLIAQESEYPKTVYISSKEGVNFRKNPKGEIIALLRNKTPVSILEEEKPENLEIIGGQQGYWIKVKFFADVGWVFNAYVKYKRSDCEDGDSIKDDDYFSVRMCKASDTIKFDRIETFLEYPVVNLVKYPFGSLSYFNRKRNAEIKVSDLLDSIRALDGNYKLISWSGPQGGGRWDRVISKNIDITISRSGNDDDISSVMTVILTNNEKLTLSIFNKWQISYNDVINALGNFNYKHQNWIVYYNVTKLYYIGFKIVNGNVVKIKMQQYLGD